MAEFSSVWHVKSFIPDRRVWTRKGDLNLERRGIYILVEGTHGGWEQSTIRVSSKLRIIPREMGVERG